MTHPYDPNLDVGEPRQPATEGTAALGFESGSFSAELLRYETSRFTGKLTVAIASGESWQLYLHLGNLVWATGGEQRVRRWRRLLQQHCPQVNPQRLVLRRADEPESWDYHIIWLLALRQMAPAAQVFAMIHTGITEVLFDVVRAIALAETAAGPETSSSQFCLTPDAGVRPSEIGMLPQQAMVEIRPTLEQVRGQWQQWVEAGLTRCHPELVPVISDRQALQAAVVPKVFSNLTNLIDGQRSLRDVAAIANRDVLTITRSLIPYLRQQWLALVKRGDLPRPVAKPVPPPPAPVAFAPRPAENLAPPALICEPPLVACIDDDPQVTSLLEGIAAEAGYRFLDITDPIQALPLLLQHKPQLIVLDLVMPIANGYEICAQIRRTEQLRATPIAILTSNDGLVDRARAKLVGATDFLSKPVNVDKVLALLQAHCPLPPGVVQESA